MALYAICDVFGWIGNWNARVRSTFCFPYCCNKIVRIFFVWEVCVCVVAFLLGIPML